MQAQCEFANARITFEGRLNGMDERDPHGEYVGLTILPDYVGKEHRVKISVSHAESLGRLLLKNT